MYTFAVKELLKKIQQLKKAKNAVIFAHNYQRPEVQDVADFVGDSFNLAQKGIETSADIIVFCGVNFMAETAKILAPNKKILMPALAAMCPMAGMVNVAKVRELKEAHPDAAVVCYVNTTADVKAECDICCTSANAVKIVNSLPNHEVIFVPDSNLAAYVAKNTDKKIIYPEGFCYVHSKILSEKVFAVKSAHPSAITLLHPECPPATLEYADKVLSTTGMVNFVKNSKEKEFIIGTEEGMIYVLQKHAPDKTFYCVGGQCIQQKKITLQNTYECLRDEKNEVTVDPEVAKKALSAIEKMLKFGRND
ncbi:MAG: quinolinate synthetase complex subunit A, quinolinate synthase [Candidatus Peregrinibacteria bacterium GW2011_GWF2_43_17]|nr:MAG: quinolinate synthetase complex subunit A, quinolinate synthase [Candidatus Peregrinibacteria bacterium GW2011_GWF2_43_17]KKT18472.1 MAG: Quinolinate synthase A [Candidatus Peregrinibacteria bacterium GW2011_GWA2_43_8]